MLSFLLAHAALAASPVTFTTVLEDGSAKATISLSAVAASRDGRTIDPPIPDLTVDGDFATAQMKAAGDTTVTLELGFEAGDLDVQAITYTPAGSERAVVVWGDGAEGRVPSPDRCSADPELPPGPCTPADRALPPGPCFELDVFLADGSVLPVAVALQSDGGVVDPGSIVGFNPQPEPPGDRVGFNPQPEPPGDRTADPPGESTGDGLADPPSEQPVGLDFDVGVSAGEGAVLQVRFAALGEKGTLPVR